jgi:hypothetical protein
MTNDEGMTKPECQNGFASEALFGNSFVIRHSDFVI